jgi:sec-independent protein translocase protein TatA
MGLVFLIVLLIFGPSQIPKMARGLGQALREFRKAQREITDEVNREEPTPPEKPAPKP